MADIDSQLLSGLPVRVHGVEVQDPIVTMFGEHWSLTVACPWVGVLHGRPFSWTDDDIEDQVWELVGQDLTGLLREGSSDRFLFSAGLILATPDTDLDPWVLELDGKLIVGQAT